MIAPAAARGPLGLGPGPEAIVRAVAGARRQARLRFRLIFVLTWIVLVGALVLLIGSTGRVDLDFLGTWAPLILGGIPLTIAVSVVSIIFATLFAVVGALGRLSRSAPIYAAATVEAADEHATVRDRRCGIAVASDLRSPDHVAVARRDGVDLAGASDAEDPLPIGRRARVEALEPKHVAAKVLVPDLVSVARAQAEDRARVRRDEEAVAGD